MIRFMLVKNYIRAGRESKRMSFPQISLEEEIDQQIGQAASLVLLEDFSIHFRECSFLCNTTQAVRLDGGN